jgi:hypothetical protein
MGVPPALAAMFRARNGFDPQVATALTDMRDFAFVLTWAFDALILAAAAVVVLQTRALPRLLGGAAAILAPGLLIGIPFSDSQGFIPFVLTMLWISVAGVAIALRARRWSEAETAPSAVAV